MEELIEKLKDILELDELDVTKRLADYEQWDSLSTLLVISMLNSDYGITMTKEELNQFASIEEFCKKVIA
ncbi:MAG: acyl carrier protein [Paludibacteraceae bacterium]|nr:acyl carrier protein [Paludibacteraceae bacterium]